MSGRQQRRRSGPIHFTRAVSGLVCRKRRFDTAQAAWDELMSIRRRFRAGSYKNPVHKVQWCWECNAHHLTSKQAKKTQ